MQALNIATAGQTYIIKWLCANSESRQLINAIDLREGMPIKLIQKFYGSILIRYNGHIYGLSEDIADKIKVAAI